ncbi:MAG: hypothetical protein KDI47_13435 [Gammaproteobacteria bacterium]|nr:hypothetical protein [Gammaproteobacteria bacterium]
MLGKMNKYRPLRTGWLLLKVVASAFVAIVASLVTFLAASTKISGETEATANAARGGIFNHRTGKFDDGTDPAGWYEKG